MCEEWFCVKSCCAVSEHSTERYIHRVFVTCRKRTVSVWMVWHCVHPCWRSILFSVLMVSARRSIVVRSAGTMTRISVGERSLLVLTHGRCVDGIMAIMRVFDSWRESCLLVSNRSRTILELLGGRSASHPALRFSLAWLSSRRMHATCP